VVEGRVYVGTGRWVAPDVRSRNKSKPSTVTQRTTRSKGRHAAQSKPNIPPCTVLHRGDTYDKQNLFYLLVLLPLVCSVPRLLAWRRFDLTPKRTVKMRDELKKLDRGGDMDPLLV
jgi:hypothetical protein